MRRILVTRQLPGEATAGLAREGLEVDIGGPHLLPRDELLRRVVGCTALLCQLAERVDREVLDAAGPRLRVVSNYAVGTNNVDVPLCTSRGIWVGCTPGVLTEATADIAWALLLAAARRVGEGERLIRGTESCNWAPSLLLGKELSGATLAVIGPGRIGTAVARRAAGWRMKLLYVGRSPSPAMQALGATRVGLPVALARADVISLHVPLNAQTRHLIGAAELGAMRRDAILINTSRGAVVDEAALVAALQGGVIGSAGLDVYEHEPQVHPGLLGLSNVVLLPHIGSATATTRGAMAQLAVDNIVAVLSGGRPLHAANEVGDEGIAT